jgi:hypothetical protein
VPTLIEPASLDAKLAALAGYGLAGCRRSLPGTPLLETEWIAFLDSAVGQRLIGLLAAAIVDEAFPVSDSQYETAATVHTEVAALAVSLERLLLQVAERLTVEGIEVRVLKGPALAHIDYPEPALRSFSDIDLLVRTADFGSAIAVLEAAGGRRNVPEIRPGFDRRFGKGATVSMPGGLEVDLHRTFVAGPLGLTIDLDELFASSTLFELADRKLEGLAAEERFLQICFNAGLGRPAGLHALRDVAQFALAEELDLDRVFDLARRWQAQAVVARAVNLTWSTLDLADSVPLSAWAGRYRPQLREARVLNAYVGGDQSYTRQALAAIRVIPRGRDRLAYARALLFPGPAHLEARHTSRLGHLFHGTRHLRP